MGSTQNNFIQRPFPWLSEVKEPRLLDMGIIKQIQTEAQAVALCWSQRRIPYTQADAAEKLEINRGVFSQVLNGDRAIPPGKRIAFQRLCENWALTQYEAYLAGINEPPKRRASDWGGRRGDEQMRRTA